MKTKTTNNPQIEVYDIIPTETGYEVEHTDGMETISEIELIDYIIDEGLNCGYYRNEPDSMIALNAFEFLDHNYREVIEKYLNR